MTLTRLTRSLRPPRPVTRDANRPATSIQTAHASTNTHHRIAASVLACTEFDLRLQMDANPAKGESISVGMELTDGSFVIADGIVHWTEMQGGFHEVGVFLTAKPPSSVICANETNRRKAERYRCRISGRLHLGPNQRESEATLVNYSFQGLAIQSSIGCQVDDKFSFRWLAGDSSRVVEGKIMWQISQDNTILMGAELSPGDGFKIAGL